jgi:glycogen synthase
MNITWITAKHPPDTGGMAESSGRIVNSLRDRGHSVTVLHLTKDDKTADPVNNQLTIAAGTGSLLEPERLFWLHRNIMRDSMLVGFGGNHAGYFASLWSKWLKTKSLVLFRGNDFDKFIHNFKRSWLTHFILDNADIIGAVSVEMASRIRTLRQKPVIVTPNSIDSAEWVLLKSDMDRASQLRKSLFKEDKSIVAMFGDLKSKKGLDVAFSLFTSFGFNEQSHLMTVGSISDKMSDKLSNNCNESWAHVAFQKRSELPAYYAASDVVFIPSLYDGMPNVLLEAMSLGRVVLASRAGALPDVIQDGMNGFLYETNDLADAAKKLGQALEMNIDDRTQMGNTARMMIEERYSPVNEVGIIEDAIGNVGN